MWKHKNFINLQLHAVPPITYTAYIYVNGSTTATHLTVGDVATWTGAQIYNTSIYTISGNTIVWNDGTILQYNNVDVLPTDEIVSAGEYTTRSGGGQHNDL